MAPVSISDLPNEALCNIFQHFCLHCCGEHDQPATIGTLPQYQEALQQRREAQHPNLKSWYGKLYRNPLCSLSLTSKRFRDVAQPILYHEFAPGYGEPELSYGFRWRTRLVHFMRTLSQRPDLAQLVKVVYVHQRLVNSIRPGDAKMALLQSAEAMGVDLPTVWRQRATEFQIPGFVLSAGRNSSGRRLAKQSLPRRPISYEDLEKELKVDFGNFLATFFGGGDGLDANAARRARYRSKLTSDPAGNWPATELFAMLLAQLPNLEHLDMQEPDLRLGSFRKSALTALNVSHLPLKTLDLYEIRPITEVAPGLETLNIKYLSWRRHPVPTMPNLKVLRISHCEFMDADLKAFLSAYVFEAYSLSFYVSGGVVAQLKFIAYVA